MTRGVYTLKRNTCILDQQVHTSSQKKAIQLQKTTVAYCSLLATSKHYCIV